MIMGRNKGIYICYFKHAIIRESMVSKKPWKESMENYEIDHSSELPIRRYFKDSGHQAEIPCETKDLMRNYTSVPNND